MWQKGRSKVDIPEYRKKTKRKKKKKKEKEKRKRKEKLILTFFRLTRNKSSVINF